MSETPAWVHQAACARKRDYPSYASAKEVLAKMRANGISDVTLHVYRCEVRGHYHIGRASGDAVKRLEKRARHRA